MHELALVWFRRDLRLSDNPTLARAIGRSRTVQPVAIEPAAYDPGPAATSWRRASLASLAASLASLRSTLVVRSGAPAEALVGLAREIGADAVYLTRAWDPRSMDEELAVRTALEESGIEVVVTESAYVVAPGTLATAAGGSYRVFTPFFRAWERAIPAERPIDAPSTISSPQSPPAGDAIVNDSAPVLDGWQPGEQGARQRLDAFVRERLGCYDADRDRPDLAGTSKLSPHLAAGELSPRQVLDALNRAGTDHHTARPFVRQLAWREFAAHVMHAFPDLTTRPLRSEFERFPWRDDAQAEQAWRAGRTGFPLVDAGMRQLARTGWMHNRVRLVAASVLTKDLLIPWQSGERYFRDTLVDYDPASNAFNWQWVAGCGADAAPYFRIFNPAVQGARFDPDATYVRQWVQELDSVDAAQVHRRDGIPQGDGNDGDHSDGYPEPIIDHAEARARALSAYDSVKQG